MADTPPEPRGTGVGGPSPRTTPTPPRVQVAPLPPETSSSSVQTIMLSLGALLLGIAAIVFVGVAITDLESWSQLAILLAVSAAFLTVAPLVATRGLAATAETLAAVGLVLFSVAGYPLWSTGVAAGIANQVYIGLVAASTAAVSYGYHRLTGLAVPRWAALLALQPVMPLLLAPQLTGPAGWSLGFALVATHNAALAAATSRPATLAPARPAAPARGLRRSAGLAVLDRGPLTILGWALHGAALAISIGYALGALFLAGTVTAAVPGALTLLLAGTVAAAAGLGTGRISLAHLGAGILTLAVIVAAARLLALALPGRALLPTAAVMAGTAVAVRLLPPAARRGPRQASAWALVALGVVVAGLSLRAGFGAIVWPPWPAELSDYPARLAAAAGPSSWQLAATAAAATIGAGFSLPAAYRREVAVIGAGLTALAAPASLAMPPQLGAWSMLAIAAGLGLTGLSATTFRAAACHTGAAAAVGLVAAGASLVAPSLTATILVALTVTGVVIAGARPQQPPAELVTGWSAGAATLALPGAAATTAYAAGLSPSLVLGAGFAAVCGSLGYASLTQLRDRQVPLPVWAGAGLSTLVVVTATFLTDPHAYDAAIALLLLITAVLVGAGSRIDAIRPGYRMLDSADLAAAAVTASIVVTLARIAAQTLPFTGADAALTTASALVLAVTLGVRRLPLDWRRGPVFGVSLVGAVVATVATVAAVISGVRALALAGPIWDADLTGWSAGPSFAGLSWAPSLALGLLAIAAAIVLPTPFRHHTSAGLAVLATIGASAGLHLPWWGPAALATAVGAGYAFAALVPTGWAARTWAQLTGAAPPAETGPTSALLGNQRLLRSGQAAWPRATAAAVLAGYALCASLSRPWLTAVVLGMVALTGTTIAALAAGRGRADPRLRIGGTAVAGTLIAVPGVLVASAAQLGHGAELSLPAALAGVSLGLAVVAALHLGLPATSARPGERPLTPYLGYATVGIAATATAIALASLASSLPTAVYGAAAVLLAVLSELVRAAGPRPTPAPRTLVSPPVGALVAAAIPAGIALIAIAPALRSALIDPYHTLLAPWDGPPAVLLSTTAVPATSVLAALLLTLAAALAAVGFGGAVATQAVPLTAPGLAITLLIAPTSLNAPWPTSTVAALLVFTIAMLGVALTPPPLPDRTVRPLRVARMLVLGVGLAGGGAGLAGSLASPQLTWATAAGAVAVGATAALGGHTRPARLLGWLFAAGSAQAFALVTAYLLGLPPGQYGFLLLAVSAVALLLVARLPRLRPPREPRELAAVETVGGYLPMLVALILAYQSIPDLATLLIGAGAVLGLAAVRSGRSHRERRVLWWLAAISEVLAWWLLMLMFDVGLIEAYTLPFAALALLVGALENRYRPDLGSWATYGPGLAAALAPSLLVVITTTSPHPVRQIWVILAGVATVLLGSRLGQRAPLIIGAVVTAVAALHLLSLAAGPWLLLFAIGVLLLVLGAGREKRSRDLERLRGAYSRMR